MDKQHSQSKNKPRKMNMSKTDSTVKGRHTKGYSDEQKKQKPNKNHRQAKTAHINCDTGSPSLGFHASSNCPIRKSSPNRRLEN